MVKAVQLVVVMLSVLLVSHVAAAATPHDWPMWGYDAGRSGKSIAELPATLHLHWVRELPAPRRAWPRQLDEGSKLEFDMSYSPVVIPLPMKFCAECA